MSCGILALRSFETSGTTHPSIKRHIFGFKVFEALRDAVFRREVAVKCALLCYYTGCSGKSLPTFRGNLSAPSLSPYRGFGKTYQSRLQVLTEVSGQLVGPVFKSLPTFWDNLSVHSVRNYHYSLRNCPEESSSRVCSCICWYVEWQQTTCSFSTGPSVDCAPRSRLRRKTQQHN